MGRHNAVCVLCVSSSLLLLLKNLCSLLQQRHLRRVSLLSSLSNYYTRLCLPALCVWTFDEMRAQTASALLIFIAAIIINACAMRAPRWWWLFTVILATLMLICAFACKPPTAEIFCQENIIFITLVQMRAPEPMKPSHHAAVNN